MFAIFCCVNNIGRVRITIEKSWKGSNGESLLSLFVFCFFSTSCLFRFAYVMGNCTTGLLRRWCRGKMLCCDLGVPDSNPIFKQSIMHYHDNVYQGLLSRFLSQPWMEPLSTLPDIHRHIWDTLEVIWSPASLFINLE